jgi:hypothetical protein
MTVHLSETQLVCECEVLGTDGAGSARMLAAGIAFAEDLWRGTVERGRTGPYR